MKSGWETYKGRQIFCARYDHMTAAEVQAEAEAIQKAIQEHPKDKLVLVLVDTTGTIISPSVLNVFKETVKQGHHHHFRTAVLGITGPRRALFDILQRATANPSRAFDNAEQAKEWLVSDAEHPLPRAA